MTLSLWKLLRKYRKNWPSWNEHKQWNPFHSPFVDCDCPAQLCLFWFWCWNASPLILYGLAHIWDTVSLLAEEEGFTPNIKAPAGKLFSSPLMCLGIWDNGKDASLALFTPLSPGWKLRLVNIIVFYLFHNGYLAKGYFFLCWTSNESFSKCNFSSGHAIVKWSGSVLSDSLQPHGL